MCALPKMDNDGLIHVPREVRDEAGLKPGDPLQFRVLGPGEVVFKTCARDSDAGSRTQGASVVEPNDDEPFHELDSRSIELRPMSLKEFVAKYGPGESIEDWNAFREAAEAEQGDEVVRRIRAGIE